MAGADFDSVGRPREFDFSSPGGFTLTVPANRLYEIYAVAFFWGASGNAGNRLITVQIEGRQFEALYQREARTNPQTAGESRKYVWAPGMPDETAFNEVSQLLQPMPLLTIGEGGSVRVRDLANIDAADILIGGISVREYNAK